MDAPTSTRRGKMTSSTPAALLCALLFILSACSAPQLALAQLAGPVDFEDFAPSFVASSRAVKWAAGSLCCDNCQYDSTCCCPPRNALPVISVRTSVKLKRTTKTTVVLKTVVVATRILTRTAGKVAGRRGFLEEPEIGSFSEGEPVAGQDELVQDDAPTEDEAEDYSTEHVQLEARSLPSEPIQPISPYESISSNTDTISQIHQLAPRHGLCRACPSGTSVLPRSRPGRSYDWSSLQACCPSRRTILRTTVRTKLATKLIKVTKRVRRTLTRTFTTVQGAKQTVTGRLFVDTNKNGIYEPGIDHPYNRTSVFLRVQTNSKITIVASGQTNSEGYFVIVSPIIPPQVPVEIAKDSPTNAPLVTVIANSKGGVDAPVIPAVRPSPPVLKILEVNQTTGECAVVCTSGTPGSTANLYANNSLVANTTISPDGSCYIPVPRPPGSGKTILTITEVDPMGVESDPAPAGELDPPAVTTTQVIPTTTELPLESTTVPNQPTTTPAPTTTATALGACSEGTAFGWIPSSYSPSSATRWALIIGPVSPGTYSANLALGASSYKNSGTGSCLAPGSGGGCGKQVGTVQVVLTGSGVSATFTISGGGATGSHLYYSCTKPVGNEPPGQYPVVTSFNPSSSSYTLSSSGLFPTCSGGYYLMLHASVNSCGGYSVPTTTGNAGAYTDPAQPSTTEASVPTATSVTSPGGSLTCTGEGTGFGWTSGQTYSPSSATRWALIIGPIAPGTYSAQLALGASSYKSSSTGSCSTPGSGGGCGTLGAYADYSLTSTGISVTYSPISNSPISKAHVYYSCTKPVGSEAPGSYNIVSDWGSSGTLSNFTLSSTGTFPSCGSSYYLMIHASILTGCTSSVGGPAAATTTRGLGDSGKTATKTVTKTRTSTAISQPKTTTAASAGGSGTCSEGTGFGWTVGQTYSPSSATRWSLIIGPIGPGSYSAQLALGASSYKSSSTGSCSAPGTGGGCGTVAANTNYTLTSSGIAVTYNPISGNPITKAHVYYSCTKPVGNEAPGSYPIVSDWGTAGTSSSFTLSSTGTFPSCGSAYYLMIHASILSGC